MINKISKFTNSVSNSPLVFSVSCFSIAWVVTYSFLRLVWGNKLGLLNPLLLLADFIAPLGVVIVFILVSKDKINPFKLLGFAFIGIFLIVLLNLVVIKMPLMNYGDVGSLSTIIGNNQVFPRWMLGTGILNFIGNNLPFHIFGPNDDILFVKVASSTWMCLATVLLLGFIKNRLSLVLTFTSAFWLLLSSGYDEYYPFIAPLFVFFLVILFTPLNSKSHPVLFGVLAAIIGLSYAGFLPLCLILLFVFTLWRGLRNGVLASVICIISSVGLIYLFWGPDIAGFWRDFYFNLNIHDPEYFPGQAIASTLFFKPQFAFGIANLKRILLELFWSGSIPYFLLSIGFLVSLVAFNKFRKNIKTTLIVSFFFFYQILFFIFMIPQLGIVNDIDLYFTVYITLTFTAGWTIDQFIQEMDEKKRKTIQFAAFSLCLGSTSVVSLYLIFLGLYALV